MPDVIQSKGHIGFAVDPWGVKWEFYRRAGSVYKAHASAPVMPDGYRSGRWFGFDRESTYRELREIWGLEVGI